MSVIEILRQLFSEPSSFRGERVLRSSSANSEQHGGSRAAQLASWHIVNPWSDHRGSGKGRRRCTFRNTSTLIQDPAGREAL